MRYANRKGFTLLELVVVIGIVVIISGLAAGSMRELAPRMRTQSAAEQFAKDLNTARMYAMMNNVETRVQITDYDSSPGDPGAGKGAWQVELGNNTLNSTSWDILPKDVDSVVDDSIGRADLSQGQWERRNVGLVEPEVWFIYFNPGGWVSNEEVDFAHSSDGSSIEVEFSNKAYTGPNKDVYRVKVYRGGMTRIDGLLGPGFDEETAGTAVSSSSP